MNNRPNLPNGFDALTWLVIAVAVIFIVTPLVLTAVDPNPAYRLEVTTP
ncbi:hypothetical protein [Nocardioides marmoriginsengisoli]|nr:hypothetical protein [Nocardioides marmoriginsengisoli]